MVLLFAGQGLPENGCGVLGFNSLHFGHLFQHVFVDQAGVPVGQRRRHLCGRFLLVDEVEVKHLFLDFVGQLEVVGGGGEGHDQVKGRLEELNHSKSEFELHGQLVEEGGLAGLELGLEVGRGLHTNHRGMENAVF